MSEKKVIINYPNKTPEWMKDFLEKLIEFDPSKRHKIKDAAMIFKSAFNCSYSTGKMLGQ